MKPSPPSDLWHQLNNSVLLRFLLLFFCGWAIVQLITFFHSTIAIFTAAAIFAALLNYPVQWLTRYMPRSLAIATAFLGALIFFLLVVTALGFQVVSQGENLISQIIEFINAPTPPLDQVLEQLKLEQLTQTLRSSLISGLSIVQSLFSSVFIMIFTAVISLYMLIDGSRIWAMCLTLIPVGFRDRFATTFQQSFLGFLRGQLLLIVFLSTVSYLIFAILGVNYALFLALIVGILDAIPGIGATLGVVVVTALIFASQGWELALKVLLASVLLQQLQDNYVHPRVMGKALEINPVLLFFALFIGERVAGILGIFLAIPLAGMIAAWLKADALEKKQLTDASTHNGDSLPVQED